MRVLWFSTSPSLYDTESHSYNGAGWVESLERLVVKQPDVELGICFFHATATEERKRGNVIYYPIKKGKGNRIANAIHNLRTRIDIKQYDEYFLKVINDFKPDLIQIFGTEDVFSTVQLLTNIPVVVHLQGLLLPYTNAFYPPGINKYSIYFNRFYFRSNLLGTSLAFVKKRFEKGADRELFYLKKTKFLMGRTNWDKTISKLIASQATYFHINEVLRFPFYNINKKWMPKQRDKIIIVSTLSNTIYKGFDLILKTARLLKGYTGLSFEWQVAGLNDNDTLVKFFEHQLGIKCRDYNITLTGIRDCDELIKMLKDSDLFVHPSYIDNSPNSVCEAQITGVPVIACNVGGLSSLIENGVNGVLVPSNAPYELVSQIIALSADKNRAESLSKNARETALVRHDQKTIVSDLFSCYDKIIDSKNFNIY